MQLKTCDVYATGAAYLSSRLHIIKKVGSIFHHLRQEFPKKTKKKTNIDFFLVSDK